jgi:propanediol dehydratase large subunit
MPPKKTTTEKKKARGDIFDFFVDASRQNSTVGMEFLEELNKKGMKAIDVYKLLTGWGYDDVRLEDVTKLLKIYRTKGGVEGTFQPRY